MEPISSDFAAYIAAQEPELSAGLAECLEGTAPSVSVRLNRRKLRNGAMPLTAQGGEAVPWCAEGRYLPSRPDFTHDPAMHQGLYYVQDASSMITSFVTSLLARRIAGERGVTAPLRYLDACAAPGGKTTAAIDALPGGSLVVANEFDFRRAEILKENVMKWGYHCVAVSRGDTARLRGLTGMFDIVAADVPCSGEGMMRKDETARRQWSRALVSECAVRQREIMLNTWEALRPGGYFIYSTCTFNRVENEENVEWLAERTGAGIVDMEVPGEWGIVSRGGMMRFLPTRLRGEGLFMAVLHKPDAGRMPLWPTEGKVAASAAKRRMKRHEKPAAGPDKKLLAECAGWIEGDVETVLRGDAVWALGGLARTDFARLDSALDLILCGIDAGVLKGKGVMPAQGLAMSELLKAGAFPAAEVDTASALAYLRRETLGGFDAPRGALLLTHGGHPLGFVNNLGNRANNLYPANWRILH